VQSSSAQTVEVAASRPDMIIKNKKDKTCTPTGVEIPADRNIVQKGSGKEVKIQEFRYRDTANVEPEMYDYTSHNQGQWNSNGKLKEKLGSYTRKTVSRFTAENSDTLNIAHNMERSTGKKKFVMMMMMMMIMYGEGGQLTLCHP
jgi:hypothetical protein